jgi:4'-phosphopantetheinyl transferase
MKSVLSWCVPSLKLTMPFNEVHVWRAVLDMSTAELERLARLLSPDEQVRARRFRFQKDQEHFIAARGILREILSRYLVRDAAQLLFGYGPFGKPGLAPGSGADGLCFSLSHSQGLALFAITRDREIGVDLEQIQTDFAWELVAGQFFSAREVGALRSLPAAMGCKAFFDYWTCREAYVKAKGDGLGHPLDDFESSLIRERPADLKCAGGRRQETCRWTIEKLDPGTGYAAALAVSGQGWQLRCWRWQ